MIFSKKALATVAVRLGAIVLCVAFTLGTAQGQKTVKDPAEYDTYMTAMNTQDPAQKAQLMEAFVKQYPDSIIKVEALEQAMGAYQQAGNGSKMVEMAERIRQLAPDNVRALAIVAAISRTQATGADQAALKEACLSSQAGLKLLPSWQKPEGVSDADFENMRTKMADFFNGAAGLCALRAKDYSQARDFFTQAFQIDPTNFQDVYQLSQADLEMNPIDVNGLWYCAKAISLLEHENNTAGVQSASPFCKYRYKRYHGSEDGWDQLTAQAATQAAPPANFAASVTHSNEDCDLAVQTVKENDPGGLSFSDWEYILSQRDCSPAGGEAAQKTWAAIQAKQKNGEAKLKITVKVISSTADTIMVAITDDNIAAKKADMQVKLTTPQQNPPAPGTEIQVIGVITRYMLNPFLFVMEKAEVAQ
jgi:tetratricopeptide (TPR) repeat protein